MIEAQRTKQSSYAQNIHQSNPGKMETRSQAKKNRLESLNIYGRKSQKAIQERSVQQKNDNGKDSLQEKNENKKFTSKPVSSSSESELRTQYTDIEVLTGYQFFTLQQGQNVDGKFVADIQEMELLRTTLERTMEKVMYRQVKLSPYPYPYNLRNNSDSCEAYDRIITHYLYTYYKAAQYISASYAPEIDHDLYDKCEKVFEDMLCSQSVSSES